MTTIHEQNAGLQEMADMLKRNIAELELIREKLRLGSEITNAAYDAQSITATLAEKIRHGELDEAGTLYIDCDCECLPLEVPPFLANGLYYRADLDTFCRSTMVAIYAVKES